MQGTQRGTRSWVSRIIPRPKAKLLGHQGCDAGILDQSRRNKNLEKNPNFLSKSYFIQVLLYQAPSQQSPVLSSPCSSLLVP